MERYFPADVSLRVSGEIADAQPMFPAASQLLSRAIRMQETGSPLVRLIQPGTDGSLIQVFLHMGLKHVYVQPAPRRVGIPVLVPEEEEIALITTACPDMLSGVVYPGTVILLPKENVGDPDVYTVHQFHPTAASANVYSLDYLWQDVERLAVDGDPFIASAMPQVKWPKPSMYSGAMKRVVQALYGIGKTSQADENAPDGKVEYEARNHYDYHWHRSHGAILDNGIWWLVEVSKERGVLAMRLPLFDCTTTEAYLEALIDIGDVDTYAIVSEFGGLPNGETFPENDENSVPPIMALDEAIAAGNVIMLLSANDIGAFYVHGGSLLGAPQIAKQGFWAGCGWAFSKTTGEAVNTCYWDAPNSGEDYPFCELWQLKITFSGIPSAEIAMLETGLFNGRYGNGSDNPVLFFPTDDYRDQGLIRPELFGHIPVTKTYNVNSAQLIAPILAFYNIDALEVVRFRPWSGWRDVATTLNGYKDTARTRHYKDHIDPTYVNPPNVLPEKPQLNLCPDWWEWEYNVFYWPGYNDFGAEAFYATPGFCEDGRPAWSPVLSESWYHATTGGWVAVDEFVPFGWGWGSLSTGTIFDNLYDFPNMRRLDFTYLGPNESPMFDGMSYWINNNWKYVYQVLDRPRSFYGTSLNINPDWEIRNEPGTSIYSAPGRVSAVEVRLTNEWLNTDEIDIGLIVPGGVRESYVLMRALRRYEHIPIQLGWTYGPGNYPNGRPTERRVYDAIEARGFVSGIGVVALENLGDLKPGSDYAYIDLLPSGAVASTTTFRYAWWFRDEWRYSNLAFPVMHASAASGHSGNYISNKTVYSYKTRYETQSKFVENVPCGMSAVEPRYVTFVGGI